MAEQEQNRKNFLQLKILFLGLSSVVLFTASWWFLNSQIYNHKPLTFWLGPILLTSLSIASLVFFTLTNSNRIWFWIMNSIVSLTYILIFPKDIYVILGGVAFFILVFLFEKRIKVEEDSRADFSIRRVMVGTINIIIYGLLLLLAFNLYYNTNQDFRISPEAFYRKLGESAARNVDRFNFDQNLEQYLAASPVSEEDFREILARALAQRVREAAKPYDRFFPLIFTIVVIALLRTFAFLFRWLTMFLTWLLFKFLLLVKFFRIEKVPVEVDKLII